MNKITLIATSSGVFFQVRLSSLFLLLLINGDSDVWIEVKKKPMTAESFDSSPAAFCILLSCFKFGTRLKVGHMLDGTCSGINHT